MGPQRATAPGAGAPWRSGPGSNPGVRWRKWCRSTSQRTRARSALWLQAPGVSLAVGVLSGTVEGRVNDLSMSTAVCGSSYHWSVAYGHGEGVEILGNKWGDGPGIYNENVVHVLVDMDARTLAYAVNGQCHGTKSLSASRVRLAAAVSRPKDAIRLGDGASAPACLFEAAQAASAASASARGVAWAVVLAWISS
ncbi:unnamed protein product [Effrenium voratum]|nr:unnamed protein product [Effrenium voratum]